jgi:hypothetical protein
MEEFIKELISCWNEYKEIIINEGLSILFIVLIIALTWLIFWKFVGKHF